MPQVVFATSIRRHAECGEVAVAGSTVREALDQAFARWPAARSYVVDEQRELRPHIVVFVNGRAIRDRRTLSDPLDPAATVHVFQALSGG